MNIDNHGPLPPSNYTTGRDGTTIDRIILHTMVGWIASADARFKNPTAQVSAHYGIRVDGTIWQWVAEADAAYHAGDYPVNLSSIGIEHEDGGRYNDPRTDVLYDASAQLVADICHRYNIPIVRGTGGPGIYDHRQVHATACPDSLDTDRIIREAIGKPAITVPSAMSVLGPSLPFTAPAGTERWAFFYRQEAPKAGIRAEMAFAQALHETANFTFTGIAKPEWFNPAGLGVTGSPNVGNRFPNELAGTVAHLQHLLWYFTPDHTPYCTPLIDQRHGAHRGLPNDISQLDGRWAIPGVGYGASIAALAARLTTTVSTSATGGDVTGDQVKDLIREMLSSEEGATLVKGEILRSPNGYGVALQAFLDQTYVRRDGR